MMWLRTLCLAFLSISATVLTTAAVPAHDWNGLARDKVGNLLVVDAEDGRVWKVSPLGKIEVFLKKAPAGIECEHPHHIAIDQNDVLHIPSG